MSIALDLYRRFGNSMFLDETEKEPAWQGLHAAASEWRQAGRYLSAAYAMDRAAYAGWGVGDRVDEAMEDGVKDCQECVSRSGLDSLEALGAINLWPQLLRYADRTAARPLHEWLQQEMADRLLHIFGERPDAVGFLVRGVLLTGSLDEGDWQVVVPDSVTMPGTSTASGERLSIALPSAFALLRRAGDRDTLSRLIDRFPAEFETVPLRGWKLAVDADRFPVRRAELLGAAADAFAADTPPQGDASSAAPRAWSGENVHIWAKYFRACAALARISENRDQTRDCIRDAATALQGTESGMVNEEVYRLRIAVKGLGALVGLEEGSVDTALDELGNARVIFGEAAWHQGIQRFLLDAKNALDEFRHDPATAYASARIVQLRDALASMPAIGTNVADGVTPAIGAHAIEVMRGIDHSYVHRALAAIDTEAAFQKIFLRLAQAKLPHYAQIRQGPLEYGKDVAVLVEESGRRILRMYQLKVGDLDMPGWRAVVPQLEEIFTVPLETIHIEGPVDERKGFLACNGHAKPHVDPAMRGWFEQERRDHGHRYEFLHLDVLARWIVDAQLFGTFRAALTEAGIAL